MLCFSRALFFRLSFLLAMVTGCVVSLHAQLPGDKIWEFQTAGEIRSAPALADDGTIYFGSADKKLYALFSNGRKKWEFATAGAITAAPAIGPDGRIYIGSTDNTLYAVSPEGTKLWEFPTSGPITEPVAIGADGTLYVTSSDGKLYAVHPNGGKHWEFTTGVLTGAPGPSFPAPTVALDGTVYVGTSTGYLYALRPDGTAKWRFSLGNGVVRSSCALDADGTIYVIVTSKSGLTVLTTGPLFALNPDGTQKWETEVIGRLPAIGQGGVLYGTSSRTINSVLPDGKLKWRGNSVAGNFGNLTCGPVICADGIMLVGGNDAGFYAVDSNGTKQWSFITAGAVYSDPAVSSDGTIYFGSTDKKFYALKGSSGLASSPWPGYRKTMKRVGAVNLNILGQLSLDLHTFAGILINGTVGTQYRIEFAESVPPGWQPLATITLDRTPYRFFDLESANSRARIYRAIEVP